MVPGEKLSLVPSSCLDKRILEPLALHWVQGG